MIFASFKNARIVRSSWLEEGGRRLDCNPYMSGALEARDAVKRLAVPKMQIPEVTARIFHAGREGRCWVEDEEYGVPFIGSSDILSSNLSALPLIAKKQVRNNPLFTIRAGWTLITRSGTIGRMNYVRSDMDGLACSEHILRVVPDVGKIQPGYLFGFLSSKFGVPLVVAGTYGAIIQHIEPHHLETISIPRFGEAIEGEIAGFFDSAADARAKAVALIKDGVRRFLAAANLPDISKQPISTGHSVTSTASSQLSRLDATFYSRFGQTPAQELAKPELNPRRLCDCVRVFTPGIFKRMYVQDPQWGYAYYSGSELFEYSPTARGYLSRRAQNIDEYLIKKNWLLIQDAGQVGGLIGRVTRAGASVDGSVVSNHLMRVVAETQEESAYVFSVLSSPYGYRAIVRNAFGSSIPQLDPKHIGSLVIPWLTDEVRAYVAKPVLDAWKLMDFAEAAERDGTSLIETKITAGSQ